jgi:hypothetical protein
MFKWALFKTTYVEHYLKDVSTPMVIMWQIVIQPTLEGGSNNKEKIIRTTHHQLYF